MALKSSKVEAPAKVYQCAHDLCNGNAIYRIKLPTGWGNVCRKHYDFHAQQEANKFCADSGLDAFEKKRSYCLQKMLMFGKVDPLTHWTKVINTPGLPMQTYETAKQALEFLKYRGREAA